MQLFIFVCVAVVGLVSGLCPEDWVQYDDACFLFSTDSRSWLDAENHCKLYSAYLASIDSKQEMDFMKNIFIALGYNRHTPYWLGGSDFVIESEWRWLKTGVGINYFAWGPGEPSGTDLDGEDCLEVKSFNGTYLWGDNDCNRHRAYYVCEKPATLTTTPATG